MKRTRFTEEQIIYALKLADRDLPLSGLSRIHCYGLRNGLVPRLPKAAACLHSLLHDALEELLSGDYTICTPTPHGLRCTLTFQ